jgi:4'-phosphopantetheinyl transferase
MPLAIVKQISPGQKLGIWQLTEEPGELLALLSPGEQVREQYRAINHEWRKKQWLASRVLLREITNDPSLIIGYDEYNKPFIPGSGIKISISHSYDLITVIASREKETGIDIELVKPKIERIAEKFMSDAEFSKLDTNNKIESMYVHWCVKEALYKLYGKKELIFKRDLIVHPFRYEKEGIVKGSIITGKINETYELRYEKTGEHMLAYVLND